VILGRASARPRRRGGSPGDGAGRGIWAGYRPGAGRLARSRAGVRDRIRPAQPWPGPAARPGPHRSTAGPAPVARPAQYRSPGQPGTDRAAGPRGRPRWRSAPPPIGHLALGSAGGDRRPSRSCPGVRRSSAGARGRGFGPFTDRSAALILDRKRPGHRTPMFMIVH